MKCKNKELKFFHDFTGRFRDTQSSFRHTLIREMVISPNAISPKVISPNVFGHFAKFF